MDSQPTIRIRPAGGSFAQRSILRPACRCGGVPQFQVTPTPFVKLNVLLEQNVAVSAYQTW